MIIGGFDALGQDGMNWWDMRYAPLNGRLEFSVLEADYTVGMRRRSATLSSFCHA